MNLASLGFARPNASNHKPMHNVTIMTHHPKQGPMTLPTKHVPSGMTSSTQDSTQTTRTLPKMTVTNACRAGKEAKRCAALFESSTSLEKRKDISQLDWSDVCFGPLVGEGSFASVFQASLVSSKQTQYYALKCLKKSVVENERKRVLVHGATDLALEANLLQHLQHENIIRIHAVKAGCILKSTCEPGGFFLLVDYLECTLTDMIAAWKHESKQKRSMLHFVPFSKVSMQRTKDKWQRLQSSALGIARGLEYLHKNNVHHGDIKPRNIGYSNGTIKLYDFGLAREHLDKRVLPERYASTPRYAAPEVLPNEQEASCASDVYSFSIVLWEICTLKKPFGEIRQLQEFQQNVIQDHKRPPLKYIPSQRVKKITSQMWLHTPEHRPCMSQVRQVLEDKVKAVLSLDEDDTDESMESTSTTDSSIRCHDDDDDDDNRVPAGCYDS